MLDIAEPSGNSSRQDRSWIGRRMPPHPSDGQNHGTRPTMPSLRSQPPARPAHPWRFVPALLLVASVPLAGCASLPEDYPRTPSTAFAAYDETLPGRAYVPRYVELVERGVRVRVLTNSLASNDVLAAHAGHAKYRRALLEAGVELYEPRADAGTVKQQVLAAGSTAGLHTKAAVFDRNSIFVGSFNFDPRSGSLNTEAGLYVESPKLAAQLIAFMDEGVAPGNAYRVQLDRDGELVWLTEVDGREIRLTDEPGATFTNRFLTDLIIALPIEDQL